jgi:hypothetical protein
MRRRPVVLALLTVALVATGILLDTVDPPGGAGHATAASPSGAVGLSLFFRNGQMAPLTLVGHPSRYLQEVDIVVTTPTTTTDQGLAPLVQDSELAGLNWTGVQLVEEDWRPDVDATWILQRFYRGAKWMEQPSHFTVTPVNAAGRPVGKPLLAQAGKDDQWQPGNDGFVRRFVARQIVRGCPALFDCSGATSFTVEGLVQLRDALHPDKRSAVIPQSAAALRLSWSADPHTVRSVAVSHAAPGAFGYGLQLSLEVLNTPPAGYFMPGDDVALRLTYRDGQGNRLHLLGSLPTLLDFVTGAVPSGIRYFDGFSLFPTTYYALKHREGNTIVTLAGPASALKTPSKTIQVFEFFGLQVETASTALDGYSAVATFVPSALILFGVLPADTPIADEVTLQIPFDALPGTYVAAFKGRRDWGGEALNRGTTVALQVGNPTPTPFVAKTGPCNTCHTGQSALGKVLHGLDDRRACYACHASLAIEPDAALDIRVHMVHSRSGRFASVGGDIQNCGLCHLTPPDGPLRDSGVDGLP